MSNELTVLSQKAQQLDAIALKYSEELTKQNTPFSSALILAEGIAALREQLDGAIMERIMRLQNSALGFLTDRPNEKNKEPYSAQEARDVIIEAALRGFYVVGNEFNVIAKRFYAAKNGLRRKLTTFPSLTDFKENYQLVEMKTTGATVKANAKWKLAGVPDSLEREFPVRLNSNMGADGVMGKAQRKLYAAVLAQLSGIQTPEAEVDDALPIQTVEIKKPDFSKEALERDFSKDPVKEIAKAITDPYRLIKEKLAQTLYTEADLIEALHSMSLAEAAQRIDEISEHEANEVLKYWEQALDSMKDAI